VFFQFKAQEYVQIVGGFVRFHANERRPHLVDRAVESLQFDILELCREYLLQFREEVFPETLAPTDDIFPEARLAFVNAQRRSATQWRPIQRFIYALFVHAMARFVERPEHSRIQPVRIKACRDAHIIPRETCAEWMGGFILPSAFKIESEAFDNH